MSERKRIPDDPFYLPEVDSLAVVMDGWRLVRKTDRPGGNPEFELYKFGEGPFDHHEGANGTFSSSIGRRPLPSDRGKW